MRLLLSILLVFVSSLSFGQWNWPVQVNTFATPNANNYLSFFSDQYSNLQIMVTLTDQNATVVPAKLSIRMEGDGWWIETNPTNAIPSFELAPFETNIITGLDLQPYFFEGNLVKSSQNLDINNLPEGDVDICVEVFGIGGTLTTIGGVQCGMTRIIKLDAAQLTVPECDVALDTINAFPTFMWSPPNGYFGGITGILEYRLRIQEVQDPNNQVYLTNPDVGLITPLTEMDWTPSTVTQANAFDLQFQVGMTYIWRVEARLIDNNGAIRNNMFRNGGISDYCIFTWGEAQSLEEQLASDLIINLDANYLTEFKGHAFWNCTNPDNQGLDGFPNYILEYRLKPDAEHPNPTWHFDTLSAEVKDIYQLSPEKTYQVRVSGKAGSYVSDPTAIVEFTTPAAIDYACGDQQIPFRPELFDNNENVQAGDQVQIGQFLMTLTEATPQYSPGHYKGKGWIPVDFLGGARAKVSFDDITIDKEYIVRDGRVDVVTDGIDAWLHEELKDFVDPIYVDGTVDSAWVDTIAGVAWITLDGVDTSFVFDPPDYPIVIQDENGYSFTIWPDGLVEVGGFLNTSNDHLDVTAENTVQFEQHPNEKYGFDPKEHIAWHENYEVIELSDSSYYFVANKSIGKDETDVVNIQIPNIVTPTFKLNDQDVLTATSVAGIYTVQIPQIGSSGKKELYVYNGNARIGKLNIHVYSEKQRDVVIVPIANVTVDTAQLRQTLKETLGEANLTFNITLEDQWNDSIFTSSSTIALPTQTSLMTSYSQDMRDLRDAYFGDTTRVSKEGAYYLFVIPNFNNPNTDGYMVQGKALGFIKSGSGLLTYAHELAHGMGALEHSWKANGPPQGTTYNLMDYSPGAFNLIAQQWKEMRDFDLAPSLWDDAEDAQGAGGSVHYYAVKIKYVNGTQERILSRSYLGRYQWIKQGPVDNPSCTKGNYTTGVNKFFKKVNGEWVPFRYEHFGKVFYLGEITDQRGNHIRYADDYSNSNTLKKTLVNQGKPADGVYEVKTQYLSGQSSPYSREVRNYELIPLIDHYFGEASGYQFGAGRALITFNSKELSNEFEQQVSKVNNGQMTYGNLVLWLESHPDHRQVAGTWSYSDKQLASSMLVGSDNDLVTGPAFNTSNGWTQYFGYPYGSNQNLNFGTSNIPAFAYNGYPDYVENPSAGFMDYRQGLNATTVYEENGVWKRSLIELTPSSYYSTGADQGHIHAKHGASSCTHSLSKETTEITGLLNLLNDSNFDSDDYAEYIASKEFCFLYGLTISDRISLLDKILYNDGAWVEDGENVINQIVKTATGPDEKEILDYFKNGGDYGKLKVIMDQLSEFWDDDDLDREAALTLFTTLGKDLFKYKSHYPQTPNTKTVTFDLSQSIEDYIAGVPVETYDVKYNYVDLPIVLGATDAHDLDLGEVPSELQENWGPPTHIKLYLGESQPIYPMELMSDGRVKVTQYYVMNEQSDPNSAFYVHTPITNVHGSYYLDPYDMVDVIIGENYGGAGYNKGDVVTVPVITALVMSEAIANQRFDYFSRIVTDVVVGTIAVAFSPVTGGSSLALVSFLTAMEVADVFIATAQNNEDVQGYNSEFYEAWSNIKLVVDIGSGIAAFPGLANGLVKIGTKTYQNGRSFMFSLAMNRAIRRTSLVDDFDVVGGLWKEKAVSRSFATGEDLEDMLTFYAPLTSAGSGTAQYVRISSFPAPVKSYIFAKNWDAATLGKLETDLENFALFNAVEGNKNLVDSWKKIDDLGDNAFEQLRRDPDFLKKFDDVAKDPHLNEHVFEGQVRKTVDPQTGNESWNAVGVHSNKAILDGKAALRTGKTPVGPSGVGYYEAKVKVYDPNFPQNGGWKSKTKPSTFFPDSWTPEKIQAEIARVIKNNPNPVSAQGKLKYSGVMTDGVELRVFQNLDGSFETAFPFIP